MGEETTDNPAHLLSDSPQLCDLKGYVSSYLLDIVKESRPEVGGVGVGVGGMDIMSMVTKGLICRGLHPELMTM